MHRLPAAVLASAALLAPSPAWALDVQTYAGATIERATNCIPFGGYDGKPAGFVYKNIAPFQLRPGDTIAWDSGQVNDVDIVVDVALAQAVGNGVDQPLGQFTTIATDARPPVPRGDTVPDNYDLAFTATAPFDFPGGGLIVRFTPKGVYAQDLSCSGNINNSDVSDPTAYFASRFYSDADGLYPWDGTDTSNIGIFRITMREWIALPDPIKVAVEGPPAVQTLGEAAFLVDQLNDDTWFDFEAVRVTSDQIDTAAEVGAYDVIVIGNSGEGDHDFTAAASTVWDAWTSSGAGAVVSTGWIAYLAPGPVGVMLDPVLPWNSSIPETQYQYCPSGGVTAPQWDLTSTIHPITAAVAASQPVPTIESLFNLPVSTTDLATSNCGGFPAVRHGANGRGRLVYLGVPYTGSESFTGSAGNPGGPLRAGEPDQLLEQAIRWAADNDDDGVLNRCEDDFFFIDDDGDGFGNPALSVQACAAPQGMVGNDDDCDDGDSAINPSETEIIADEIDQNCDDAEICYVDNDNDDYGSSTAPSADIDCDDTGEGHLPGECNDDAAAVHPGVAEIPGDETDQNCDGKETCYVDNDNDDYGSVTLTSNDVDCDGTGEGHLSGECNDASAAIKPTATELPGDEVDQNCDTDELCYVDGDNDDYGSTTVVSGDVDCDGLGEGHLAGECDDASAAIKPTATELPGDEIDQNCDTDELCYVDADNDDYGDATVLSTDLLCNGTGEGHRPGECDDTAAAVHPGATEVVGNDVDEDCTEGAQCFLDADDDGARLDLDGAGNGDGDCQDPAEGLLADPLDCDDADPDRSPVNDEIPGNDLDEDCSDTVECYTDADDDGARINSTFSSTDADCGDANEGRFDDLFDCDDTNPNVGAGDEEIIGDGIDQDCDNEDLCYADADLDGVGGSDTTPGGTDLDCDDPGQALTADDCDDDDGDRFPGNVEVPGDGVDQDCDSGELCYDDDDGDGYGDDTVPSDDVLCDAEFESDLGDDCDDADDTAYPGAEEIVADGLDQDCDGDDLCYEDGDGDGYGADVQPSVDFLCTDSFESDLGGDCDDTTSGRSPGLDEVCDDQDVDEDCDFTVDDLDESATNRELFYADEDNDGWGAGAGVEACDGTTSFPVSRNGDCDDTLAVISPDATEVCDSLDVDEDCDTLSDDADPSLDPNGATRHWPDVDGDGYGDATDGGTSYCEDPGTGWVLDSTDCDDSEATANPEGTEIPYDGIDQDCLGGDLDDVDGDGFASDVVPDGTDCDDDNPAVHPGVEDPPNGIDDDCNGIADDLADSRDDDQDGFSENFGDCNDEDANVFPGAIETCDDIDEDCDLEVDNDTECYDDDLDGYTELEDDCDDENSDVHPGATEDPLNGVDDDCDGDIDEGGTLDPDEDGYTEADGDCDNADDTVHPDAPEVADGKDNDCDDLIDEGTPDYDGDEDGYPLVEDCDDDDPAVHPDAEEVANEVDDDCDDFVDEGTAWYDDDGDGFVEEPDGDCDDTDPDVYPGADETDNGIDDNCVDGVDEGFEDVDLDGFGIADGDCDDSNADVLPGGFESCDTVDNDCDAMIDEDGACDEPDDGKGCCDSSGVGWRGALPLALVALALRRRRLADPSGRSHVKR